MLHPDETAQLLALGVRQLLMAPLSLGDRLLGYLSIRLTDDRPAQQENLDLVQALAGEAAVAINLARLAEQAKDAAVERERAEERALAARQRTEAAERTARTVRASLDMLAEEPELERFLGHVLRATNSQFGVPSSTLWLHDPATGHGRLHMICHEGNLTVDPLDASSQPYVIRLGEWPSWRGLIDGRLPVALEVDPKHPALEQVRVRLNLGKARSVLVVPLIFGADVLGVVAIRDSRRETWSDEELSLARALGHQATLALQLTRLAARAREGAVLQERNRLAREIHDTLAQGFAAIRMQLELARSHPALPKEAAEALAAACKIAAENIVEARRSMAVLTSDRPSLLAVLSAAVEGVRRIGHTPVMTELAVAPEPPPEVAHELSRICQEAMLNAVRHAEANEVRLTLSDFAVRGVRLAVTDDGKGFNPDQPTEGFGLAGIRERASAIKAELTIVSEPGGGTEVIATWVPE
jgi:signal transduction histidine kinase